MLVFFEVVIRDDPKLLVDNEKVLISKWSGWQFDSRCENVSVLDRKN